MRDWVRDENSQSVLWMPYLTEQLPALRTVIATWMRLAIIEALSQSPQSSRRLWFVVDELDALGAIDGLEDALARMRKFGGRCVLGFQSLSQVVKTYGRESADAIVENCGNTLILRCSASREGGTSEFASRLIGERELFQTSFSQTRSSSGFFSSAPDTNSSTTSHQRVREPAVLASQIEQLPDLAGYLKFGSGRQWLSLTFEGS